MAGKWWQGPESNRGHKDFQSSALPTELPCRSWGGGSKRSGRFDVNGIPPVESGDANYGGGRPLNWRECRSRGFAPGEAKCLRFREMVECRDREKGVANPILALPAWGADGAPGSAASLPSEKRVRSQLPPKAGATRSFKQIGRIASPRGSYRRHEMISILGQAMSQASAMIAGMKTHLRLVAF